MRIKNLLRGVVLAVLVPNAYNQLTFMHDAFKAYSPVTPVSNAMILATYAVLLAVMGASLAIDLYEDIVPKATVPPGDGNSSS